MRRITQTLFLIIVATGAISGQSKRTADEENTIKIFKQARAAVVHINVSVHESRSHDQRVSSEALGSGFLIDRQGRILTNYHVIEQSNHVEVYLPGGRQTLAKLVGTAPSLDLALLQVDLNDTDDVEPLLLGDSDGLEVGQKAISVGHPLALHNSLTVGVVSALNRTVPGISGELQGSLIQTDAAINPGNSGGPLLDSTGYVIGIATARAPESQNLGFAIPINVAKRVLNDLIEMGHPYRPALGIDGIAITPELAVLFGLPAQRGFLIQDVFPGSPAHIAGLRAGNRAVVLGENLYVIGGDVVTSINGKDVSSLIDIMKILLESRPGQYLRLTILREGRTMELALPLEPMHGPWR
jgi:S1-C subfamily serine protease